MADGPICHARTSAMRRRVSIDLRRNRSPAKAGVQSNECRVCGSGLPLSRENGDRRTSPHHLRQRLGQFATELREIALHAAAPADQHMIGAAHARFGQHLTR